MTAREKIKLLDQVINLPSNVSPENVQTLFSTFRLLINPNANLCSSCSSSVAKAYQMVMDYNSVNRARLTLEANAEPVIEKETPDVEIKKKTKINENTQENTENTAKYSINSIYNSIVSYIIAKIQKLF